MFFRFVFFKRSDSKIFFRRFWFSSRWVFFRLETPAARSWGLQLGSRSCKRRRRRKCHHCGKLYEPDARNAYHQKSCTDPDCRKASKAASQLRWRRSPKGRDYFRGSANVLRVQAWRLAHPGYWRRGRKSASPLQEVSPPKPLGVKEDKPEINAHALQDFSSPEGLLLLGLSPI